MGYLFQAAVSLNSMSALTIQAKQGRHVSTVIYNECLQYLFSSVFPF